MNSDFKMKSVLSMILAQLSKLIIFKILLQRCQKLCEFLILVKKNYLDILLNNKSTESKSGLFVITLVALNVLCNSMKKKQINCSLRQHFFAICKYLVRAYIHHSCIEMAHESIL